MCNQSIPGRLSPPTWPGYEASREVTYNVISAGTSGCEYTYVEQPPRTLQCNPYPNNELILNCDVQGPLQMAFDILWYWKPLNNQPPQELSHTGSKYELQQRGSSSTVNSRTHGRQLRVRQLNDSDTGWYFCQGNLSNATLLTPSNKLLLDMKSAYTTDPVHYSTCPDRAQSMRVPSCANITNDSSTVGTTTPNPVTGSNGGSTDTPSSSPTDDANHPSLPTTVTLAPTPTVIPVTTPESNMLQVALYAVISVIVVFCAVIVTLAVTIVILYRRKRGHANFKKTAGLFVMVLLLLLLWR